MNKNYKYSIYLGNLENNAIISLIRSNNNSRSIKSIIIPSNQIGDNLWKNIRELLIENKIEKKDLENCYVNVGPAKFNSTRLITLTAKSLAYFNNIPLYSISNLFLHYLAYKNNIAIIADSNYFFLAWRSFTTDLYYEEIVLKTKVEEFKEKMEIKNIKLVAYLTKEQHESTVLKYLEKFTLVPDASKLNAHYIKDVIENGK